MKVAVLMGGATVTREASLANGKRVCEALTREGHEVVPLDTTVNLARILREERPDIAFSTLFGFDGESGAVQELLELLEIPCVGPTSQVCRDAWDRGVLGGVLDGYRGALGGTMAASWPYSVRMSRAAFEDMGADAVLDVIAERIPGGFPLCVKPAHRSLGGEARKVETPEELAHAVSEALAVDRAIVVQQWIEGVSMQVFLLGEGLEAFVLPPVEAVPEPAVPSSRSAEASSAERPLSYYAPVRMESLSDSAEDAQAIRSEIERAALEAYLAFGMRDCGEVDVVWDGAQARVLQVTGSIDLRADAPFEQACQAASLTFDAVVNALVGGLDL